MNATFVVADGVVSIRSSQVADGDFHLDILPAELARNRARFQPGSWSQPDEVHGTAIVSVDRPGGGDRVVADGVVTRLFDEILAVWVGDCAPVALVGADGLVGAVHAGWRGALDGVLDRALERFTGTSVQAVLGPCIHPCCYEFGADDLQAMVQAFGPAVEARTAWGTPALDMPAVVAAALRRRGVTLDDRSQCTGCAAGTLFSHRRRGEAGRQVLTVVKQRPA